MNVAIRSEKRSKTSPPSLLQSFAICSHSAWASSFLTDICILPGDGGEKARAQPLRDLALGLGRSVDHKHVDETCGEIQAHREDGVGIMIAHLGDLAHEGVALLRGDHWTDPLLSASSWTPKHWKSLRPNVMASSVSLPSTAQQRIAATAMAVVSLSSSVDLPLVAPLSKSKASLTAVICAGVISFPFRVRV